MATVTCPAANRLPAGFLLGMGRCCRLSSGHPLPNRPTVDVGELRSRHHYRWLRRSVSVCAQRRNCGTSMRAAKNQGMLIPPPHCLGHSSHPHAWSIALLTSSPVSPPARRPVMTSQGHGLAFGFRLQLLHPHLTIGRNNRRVFHRAGRPQTLVFIHQLIQTGRREFVRGEPLLQCFWFRDAIFDGFG